MSAPEALPARVRHGYGAAAFSLALANTSVLFFLAKFLVDEAGLAPWLAGVVVFAGKAWDAVSDPMVGRLSDRTRSSMGSRRPWIAAAALPFLALFALIWQPLPVGGATAAWVYGVLLVLYNTAYTAVVVPYGALTPVLSEDYDERTRINAARMGWSMIGGLVAGITMPVLFERTGGFAAGGLVLAVLGVVPLAVAVVATRGRDRVQPSEAGESMWTVLRNRPFRRTAVLFLCAWTCIAVLSALLPFYVEHHLGRPDLLDAVFATIQVSALVAVPAISALARRTEKHRAYALALSSWALVLLGLALVPQGSGTAVLVLAALVGPGVAAAHVLPWSMLPDVVEADRVATGQERAGAFYGVMTFLEKGATAVALQGMLFGLGAAGYTAGAEVQPDSARLAILALIGPLPGVVLVGAALLAWTRPPLTRDAHRALVAGRAPEQGVP